MNYIPKVIGHRGASATAPENTLPAFELAFNERADGVECDVRLTADGQVVCIHDADTQRVADRKLVVAQAVKAQRPDVKVYWLIDVKSISTDSPKAMLDAMLAFKSRPASSDGQWSSNT